ncbi:MAG: hypothetical protein CFH37_00050 [Alphaproteobacteria bacterium MarineAlpha9_Bin7]|nr:MAG: hypothetical protein CFH37_00050 [Alphaproteobacteria bacterium MarineAlpha9_Bin7]
MSADKEKDGYLSGQLLIAMPAMTDPRFSESVIYLCTHNEDGAMGLVVNKLIGSLNFTELLQQMKIDLEATGSKVEVHFGGPVESGRGFVLHSTDYNSEETMRVNNDFALTATIDVLKSIAGGEGPADVMFALGYAGWAPGQLDTEMQNNGWLNCAADSGIVFGEDNEAKWKSAAAKMGIDLSLLTSDVGHA